MVTIRERVPPIARGPVSVVSLGLGVIGITLGYVITLLGITLYFDLHSVDKSLTAIESMVVIVIGLAFFVIGYLGWRGFMYFAY